MHTGKHLSVQQQIDNLRMLGESPLIRVLLPIAIVTGMAATYAFWKTDSQNWSVLWLFIAGCSGLLALATALSAGHLRNAAIATRKGRRECATLHLQRSEDSDERQFHGRLELGSGGGRAWELDFAPASGWHPQSGTIQVEAVFLSDIRWPALVLCEQGLLWPRADPRRTHKSAG